MIPAQWAVAHSMKCFKRYAEYVLYDGWLLSNVCPKRKFSLSFKKACETPEITSKSVIVLQGKWTWFVWKTACTLHWINLAELNCKRITWSLVTPTALSTQMGVTCWPTCPLMPVTLRWRWEVPSHPFWDSHLTAVWEQQDQALSKWNWIYHPLL